MLGKQVELWLPGQPVQLLVQASERLGLKTKKVDGTLRGNTHG